MKHLRTFENYETESNYPSKEEMCKYICGCGSGYNEKDCDSMNFDQICRLYDECRNMNEAKKSKAKKSKSWEDMTQKEREFAALAPPRKKITFADKIAGATKSKKGKK